jgi:hypothetical protein
MPPRGQPSRTVTIQLTRDTLILIAALAFLALAILLMVFFPTQSPEAVAPAATSPPESATSQPYPQPSALAEGMTTPIPQAGAPTGTGFESDGGYPAPMATDNPSGGYPAPGGTTDLPTPAAGNGAEEQLTLTPAEPSGAQTSPTDIPVFDPFRPTQPAAATPGDFVAQATAYPGPATATSDAEEDSDEDAVATPQPTTDLIDDPTDTPPTPRPPTQAPQPRPTSRPAGGGDAPTPRPRPQPTAAPTAPLIDVLRGDVRWTPAQSPIFVRRDVQIVAGATLIIEPGVEVRMAPGVSFFVEGTMYAVGNAAQPVRFASIDGERWDGLFGRPGSNIALEHTEIRGGGGGGTVLMSEGGNLALRHARVNENGGHIQVNDSRLEMRDSEIAGNDMPYGSALEATYSSGNGVILTNNRIGGNRLQPGTSPVRIANQSPFDTLNLDIHGNLLVGLEGPDLAIFTNGPLQGGLTCNALVGGPDGLSVRGETPQAPGVALNVRDNAIEKHTPPIIPIYLEYGIGRGATSEIAIDMRNNWWESPLGPYEPERNADGRGDAAGDNVEFAPWLTERPACAPNQ